MSKLSKLLEDEDFLGECAAGVVDALFEADARIAELEAALKPFADITEKTSAQWVGDIALYGASLHSIRAARAAYLGEKREN